jgi:hypothetical protein
MAPHNFLALAFIISSLVYIFNWGLTNPGQNSLSAGIHASSALIPEDGRLHILVTGEPQHQYRRSYLRHTSLNQHQLSTSRTRDVVGPSSAS